jgi:hypothetical protein
MASTDEQQQEQQQPPPAVGFKSFGAKTWLPQLVVVVGTWSDDDSSGGDTGHSRRPNASTAAWIGTACSSPVELAVSFRP